MTFKHINFMDSEVLRNLEAAALKKEPASVMVKQAKDEQEIVFEPSEDLFSDVIHLAAGLRRKGMVAEADALEQKLHLRQAAKKELKDEGEKLLDRAHPEGDVEVAPSSSGLGKVWTEQSAHSEIRRIVEKTPTGKQAKINKILEASKDVLGSTMLKFRPLDPGALKDAAKELAEKIFNDIENKGVSLDEWDFGGKNGKDLIIESIYHSISELVGLHKAGKFKGTKLSEIIKTYNDIALSYVENLSSEFLQSAKIDYPNVDADQAVAKAILDGPGGHGLAGIYQYIRNQYEKTDTEKLQPKYREAYSILNSAIAHVKTLENETDLLDVLIALKMAINSTSIKHKGLEHLKENVKNYPNLATLVKNIEKIKTGQDLVDFVESIYNKVITIKQSNKNYFLKKTSSEAELRVLQNKKDKTPEDKKRIVELTQKLNKKDNSASPIDHLVTNKSEKKEETSQQKSTPKAQHRQGRQAGSVYKMQQALLDLRDAIKGRGATENWYKDITVSSHGRPDNDWGNLTNTALETAQKVIKNLQIPNMELMYGKDPNSIKNNIKVLNKLTDIFNNTQKLKEVTKKDENILGTFTVDNKPIELTKTDLSTPYNFLKMLYKKKIVNKFKQPEISEIVTDPPKDKTSPKTAPKKDPNELRTAYRKKEWEKLGQFKSLQMHLNIKEWEKALSHFYAQAVDSGNVNVIVRITDIWREVRSMNASQRAGSNNRPVDVTPRRGRQEGASYDQRNNKNVGYDGRGIPLGEDIMPIGSSIDLRNWPDVPPKYQHIVINRHDLSQTPAKYIAGTYFGNNAYKQYKIFLLWLRKKIQEMYSDYMKQGLPAQATQSSTRNVKWWMGVIGRQLAQIVQETR